MSKTRLEPARRGGQFASIKDINTQKRILLAPAIKWRKDFVSPSSLSNGPKVAKWVKLERTPEEIAEEENIVEDDLNGTSTNTTFTTITTQASSPALSISTPQREGRTRSSSNHLANLDIQTSSSNGDTTRSPSSNPTGTSASEPASTDTKKPSEIPTNQTVPAPWT